MEMYFYIMKFSIFHLSCFTFVVYRTIIASNLLYSLLNSSILINKFSKISQDPGFFSVKLLQTLHPFVSVDWADSC